MNRSILVELCWWKYELFVKCNWKNRGICENKKKSMLLFEYLKVYKKNILMTQGFFGTKTPLLNGQINVFQKSVLLIKYGHATKGCQSIFKKTIFVLI